MAEETVFFPQTFTCSDHVHLCNKIREYVNHMETQGYIYINFNLVDQVKCDDNWVKYQLIIAFKKRSDR